MKVIVTGAAGKIGSVTARHLSGLGHSVRATDNQDRRDLPVPIELANLLDAPACYRLLEGAEAVVHLANHPSYHGRDEQRIFNENVTMNMNVFEAARQVGVPRIVFASSIQAMSGARRRRADDSRSEHPYLPLDGDIPAKPSNPYALSKSVSESMLAYYSQRAGMSTVALRFPAIYTDERLGHLRRERRPAIWSGWNLDECFTYLWVQDAAALVGAVLAADLPGFRVYFPTALEPTLDWPVARLVREYFADVPLRQPLETLTSLVDLSRITRETGWRPTPLGAIPK